MKSRVALFVLSLSSIPAFGQLNPLPASSIVDGVPLHSIASTPSNASWASSALFDYRLDAGNPFGTPAAGNTDSFGRSWTANAPSLTGIRNNGGTLRALFLGAAGAEVQGFGYTYGSSPASLSSYTLAGSAASVIPAALSFGDWADLPLSIHDIDSFDFWLATGSGAYTVLSPNNRVAPASQRADILWTDAPLLVSTFIPALGANADVETWVVSILEYSADQQSHTEFRFALQQFERSGRALALNENNTPVPEPSTYALFGALICGLVAIRRRFGRNR